MNCVCMPRYFSRVWFFVTPWTVAPQAPLSMGFFRQEYWSELPCPPPGISPSRDWTCISYLCWQVGSLPLEPPVKWTILQFKKLIGTSLVVQWLRICIPTQGTQVWSLVGVLRSRMPWGHRAHALQLLKPVCSRIWNEDPAHPKLKKIKCWRQWWEIK